MLSSPKLRPLASSSSSSHSTASASVSSASSYPIKFSGRGNPVYQSFIADIESSTFKKVSMVHNTYFVDPEADKGFISVPHLGNSGCLDASNMARHVEEVINYKVHGNAILNDCDPSTFGTQLDAVAEQILKMVKNDLHSLQHLGKVLIQIKAGRRSCQCVSDALTPQVLHFLKEYPIYIDSTIKVTRRSSPSGSPLITSRSRKISSSMTEILVFIEHDVGTSSSSDSETSCFVLSHGIKDVAHV